jgi:chemotaxis protein histidine kinase CheA
MGAVDSMSGGREASLASHTPAAGSGARLMLFRARGCVLALSLDAVEGVFDLVPEADGARARVPEGGSVPLVDWSSLTGVPVGAAEAAPGEVVVVATGTGVVGMAVERCLGARRVSLTASRPLPTRLVDGRGSPACLLLRVDGRPVFLLEPRVLGGAARLEAPEAGSPTNHRSEEAAAAAGD